MSYQADDMQRYYNSPITVECSSCLKEIREGYSICDEPFCISCGSDYNYFNFFLNKGFPEWKIISLNPNVLILE